MSSNTSAAADVAFVYDGKGYDSNGTLIGPFEWPDADKLSILRSFVGTNGRITLKDGSESRLMNIVNLNADSFGNLDSVRVYGAGFEKNVPVEDIAFINAGGRVVSLAEFDRRRLKMFEVNIPRELRQIYAQREELHSKEVSIAAREKQQAVNQELVRKQGVLQQQVQSRLDQERRKMDEDLVAFNDRDRESRRLNKEAEERARTAQETAKLAEDKAKLAMEREKTLKEAQDRLQMEQQLVNSKATELKKRETQIGRGFAQLERERANPILINGILLNDTGAPVSKAELSLFVLDEAGQHFKAETVITDEVGRFTSRIVQPGKVSKVEYGKQRCLQVAVPGSNFIELRVP